jgi:GTP pyrophosphokinase
MPVQWGSNVEGLFSAEMEAICHDRDRLTVDIVNVMAETKTAVTGLKVNNDRRSGTRSIIIKVEVKSLDQFEYLMQRVSRIKGVASVHRMVRHRKGEE